MDSYLAESTQAPWRRAASLVMVALLLLAAVGLTLRYRHEHRDAWSHAAVPWWGFDVSTDGRTLTFHGKGTGPCTDPTGVSFSSDPTEGGTLTATLETRTQVLRDGDPVFCAAVLSLDGPVERIRLDRPVPAGTVISDGAPQELLWPSSGSGCRARAQVVRIPTTVPPYRACTAEG